MVSAIIVAAGSSRRMGFDKLFAPLDGKPVVAHSVEAFQRCEGIRSIVIVTRPEKIEELERLTADFDKVHAIIPGGEERHRSVWNGLETVSARNSSFVAIHDGARPLTTPELINGCIALARREGAACCASPIPDTVKRVSPEQIVTGSVERSGLWAMQTPQIFSTVLIFQAYAALMASSELVTDEVSAVQKLGKKIALLKSEDWNFKITFPRDLELAEQVIKMRKAAA